ncbi:MAG: nucleotidyltransferase family protein [Chitinophagaceae bacterium]|nr:MAG: nucleotidyltransferase family protein [Chitinophagaceae bacterium]
MSTGIIILAAGNSSRLGNTKQLLTFRGKTLLATTVEAAENTSCAPIVLVLGAYANEILAGHPELNINYVINDSWEKGMSTSIAAGLSKMIDLEPGTENVIITVSDQPFIAPAIFEKLLDSHKSTGKNLIASQYAHTIGTPALFNKKYFDELMLLEGDSGAKHILTQYVDDRSTIPFELGHIDIDTDTDYKNFTTQP